ncbi:MAG: response regulator transcription factor [Dehalococcoidales bacterium]|nr:response regulator transcription factor [Dehalococcoidales bacterium]
MAKKIRVLIIDDHTIVRTGIRLLLNSQPDMEAIGEAENGNKGLALAKELRPDVIIMDINMPDMDGITATRVIKKELPEARILALTMHRDSRYFFQMLKEGALGYVLKDAEPDELLDAIRAVNQDKAYLLPDLARRLLDDYLDRLKAGDEQDTYNELTTREKEVLKLIGEGRTSREIGEMLFISLNTVERHRSAIMEKLGMHNKGQLIRFALRKGLVKMDNADS